MTTHLQRSALLAWIVVALGLAAWLVRDGSMAWPLAMLAALLLPLALQAVIIGTEFLIAWHVQDAPPQGRAGLRTWIGAWVIETLHSIRSFALVQPLLAGRPLAGQAQGPTPGRLPVLLVHGYFCNQAVWRPMARRLADRGHAIGAVNLEPTFGAIEGYSDQIAQAVRALRDRTGAPQIAMVCHSMGGLAARAYLCEQGDEGIACVVTLGTPHRGTRHADFGHGDNVRQMRLHSPWLAALAAREPPERLQRFTVIRSWQDNIIAPQTIQTLPGARTVSFRGLGHIRLVHAPQVAQAVIDALDAAAAVRNPDGHADGAMH